MLGDEFHSVESNTKSSTTGHEGRGGYIVALARYGKVTKRKEHFDPVDLEFFDKAVDSGLMEKFHYELSGGGAYTRVDKGEGE